MIDDWVSSIVAVLVLGAGVLVLSLAVATLVAAGGGWVVTIFLGDLHAAIPSVPALGYLACFTGVWALAVLSTLLPPGLAATTRGQRDQ